jgi:hypothetical protein
MMDDQPRVKVAPRKRARKLAAPVDASRPAAITTIEYGRVQAAYQHFNQALFGGDLPDVFIVYQRRAGMRGHFVSSRFSGRGNEERTHELALNPDGFIDRTDEEILSTLVHEQVHAWQEQNGTAPKRPTTTKNGPRKCARSGFSRQAPAWSAAKRPVCE